MKTTLLIDGDILAFQAASAAEHPIQWDDNFWTLHSDLQDGQKIFNEKIEEIRDNIPADDMLFCFSPRLNYRYRIWPQYKANRKNKRRPMILDALKQWVMEDYDTMLRPDIEADDVIGICATSPYIVRGKKIVVSLDKDFKTVPCTLVRLGEWEQVEITEEQADYNHMIQTLTGDSSDGYGGCPKVGPVAAAKILDSLTGYGEMWPAVKHAYEQAGQTEEQALIMARLARICRRGDYDFKRKQVILWTPKERG